MLESFLKILFFIYYYSNFVLVIVFFYLIAAHLNYDVFVVIFLWDSGSFYWSKNSSRN
jgi:hypothetical protein